MTEVEFHTGVADPLGFACRLLRKAYRKGARVLVTAPADTLVALDRALWTFDERDFVPHLRWSPSTPAALAARTPLWLAEAPVGGPEVLVNLGADVMADDAAYQRVIEILSDDAGAAQAGRARWRAYKARGLSITHHPAAPRD